MHFLPLLPGALFPSLCLVGLLTGQDSVSVSRPFGGFSWLFHKLVPPPSSPFSPQSGRFLPTYPHSPLHCNLCEAAERPPWLAPCFQYCRPPNNCRENTMEEEDLDLSLTLKISAPALQQRPAFTLDGLCSSWHRKRIISCIGNTKDVF